VFVAGGADAANGGSVNPTAGLFGTLLSLLVAEKSGFATDKADPALAEVGAFADRITIQVMQSVEGSGNGVG
jgi:hypothetical protein